MFRETPIGNQKPHRQRRLRGGGLAPGRRLGGLLLSLWLVQCGAGDEGDGEKRAALWGKASDGLVFVQPRARGSELWRARLADGALRTLTRTPEREEMWPFWSDAAGLLVIETRRTDRRGGHRLVVWDPDTGRERALASARASHEGWASWAPAGDAVAFTFSVGRGKRRRTGLATARASSGRRRVLMWSPPADRFLRPAWAPSGDRIVVQRHRGTPLTDLWLLPLEGSARPLIVDPQWHDVKASYTHDGAWIVFTRRPSTDGPGDVMRVRPDGSDLGLLAGRPESDDYTATPSPVRNEFAFVSDRDGSADVFLADLDGGGVRNLTRSPDVDETAPRWAPDGERIALTVTPPEAGSGPSSAAGSTRDDAERASREAARVAVIDREGRMLFQVPGYSPDWMPPWR